ncbi:MAG: hypothetical protein WDZ69_02540 [Candidatus Pacearchaeota archaeon]
MKTQKVLDEFVKECSQKLNLLSVIQFGSSTYSKNPKDIDLMLVSDNEVVSAEEILKLIEIVKNLENKYKDIVFDFGGISDRKRKGLISITCVYIGMDELLVKHNPHDIFLFKNLEQDENLRVLYGRNPLRKGKVTLTKQHLFEMLSVDQKHALRKCLDDDARKEESSYFLFKTFLRGMLINYRVSKKGMLLKKFEEIYKNKISLPKNSGRIIKKEFQEEDFKDILKFTEDCLRYLIK